MRWLSILFFCCSFVSAAQDYRLFSVGFYNVENFFDAVDDPHTFDEDYTPTGRKQWTTQLVEQKAAQMATVISALKENPSQKPPVLLGLAEIENRHVLELLVKQEKLKPYDYALVHFDSPDSRGIDVALLYQPTVFQLAFAKTYRLRLQSESKQNFRTTRDQLVVSGYLEGMPLALLVSHWPSRRGGQKRSAPFRMAAARLQKRIIDSLQRLDPPPQIMAMGDFNDNPDDESLLFLTQFQKQSKSTTKPFFNAMDKLYKKGIGSLAHNDQWFLFDQILLSQSFQTRERLFYVGSKIFNPPFLQTPEGRYKGYPYRTAQKGQRLLGYSDHFPVYVLVGIQTR